MKLRVIDPLQTSKYLVNWIDIETIDGNMIILSDHAPLIAILVAGKELIFECKDGSRQQIQLKKNGIIEVTRAETTILL